MTAAPDRLRRCFGLPGAALFASCLMWLGAIPAAAGAVTGSEKLPQLDRTGVVVPWEDFKKILDEIRRVEPPVPPEPPPVDFALSACKVFGVVTEDQKQVRVNMEFSLQVLNPERWVEVPVIGEGVALSRFEIDGRAANVYRKNGYHRIALRGEGRHRLALEYLAPVTESRGSHTTNLRFPQAPVIALDLSVPRSQLSFSIAGAVVRSTERSNGSARVLAAFQRARDASITWFRQAELDEKETKLFGELRTLLSLGESMMRGTTNAVVNIHGKGVDEFRIRLPAELTVLDVNAQGIEDWSVEPDSEEAAGDGRVLTVRLNYLAQGSYSFVFSFERALADTTTRTRVPDLALLDAIRDKGFVAVVAATNVEINPVGELRNATPVDPGELPPDFAALAGQQVLYGFKYLQHPVRVELSIVKHDDLAVKRTIVESAHLFTYVSPEGKRITSACYRVKNNRKQYLEVTLPVGGEGWGAYVEGRPVKAAQTEDGKILIPLKKTPTDASNQLAAFDVELVYFQREPLGSWGRHRLAGPVLDVDAMEVQWHLFLPRDKRYAGFTGNLHPDDELNRIVYLNRTAYNLRSDQDLATLRRADLGDKDVVGIAGEDLLPVPAEEEPTGEAKAKRAELERELDQLKQRSAAEATVQAPAPQGASNVAGGFASYFQTAGRVRGVLPVRFSIPVEGLRLSFTGRILTASEAPVVSIRYWPAVWVLSGTAVVLLSFALVWIILFLFSAERPPWLKIVLVVPSLALLLGLLVLVPAHRAALGLGFILALAAHLVPWIWTRRREASTLLLVLASLALAPAASRAEEVAGPARPQIPDLTETEVTLSWKDFKSLVEKTYVPPPVPPAPPAEAVLRSADYRGRLEPGVLTLEGTLTLEVLKQGWVRMPLGTEGTVVRFDGQGAMLHRNGPGLEVLARGPKTYELRLTLVFAAGDHPGENRLALTLPDAPRNLLNLSVATVFREVEVESGLTYDTRDRQVFVSLSGGAFAMKYTLPFRSVEETAGEEIELDPRVQLTSYRLLNLGGGVLSGVLVHDYNVRVAKVSHFDVELPDDVVIFDCSVEGLESWKILQQEGRRVLRVTLLAPNEGNIRVVAYFEGAYAVDDDTVIVPSFAARDIERESGFIALAADGAQVDLQLSGNLLPADATEIPPEIRAYGGNVIVACKYSGRPDLASVFVTEHEDAPVLTAIIESLNATAALLENGTEATWIDLTIKNNRKQFLKFTLPGEDVEVWSLLLDGQPTKPKRTADDVLVPLPRGNGEVASSISLVLLRRGPRVRSFGRLEPFLPSFDVPVSEALWTVYLPPGKRYAAGPGEFRPVLITDPLFPGARIGLAPKSARVVSSTIAPSKAGRVYADAVSEEVAEGQLRQEAAIAQQMMQKHGGRKGSLPVRIAIPGGVSRLPRVTVSRMLIVGDEPNTLAIRVYPAWITAALRALQPLAIVGSALCLGLVLAGVLEKRRLRYAAPIAVIGLVPFGGVGTPLAVLMLVLLTLMTRLSVALLHRLQTRSPA